MARASWFDDSTEVPNLAQKVQELESFTNAMADGTISTEELDAQQDRLITAMKTVEAELSDTEHEMVTVMLVEMTAYDIMRTVHELQRERLKMKFER